MYLIMWDKCAPFPKGPKSSSGGFGYVGSSNDLEGHIVQPSASAQGYLQIQVRFSRVVSLKF